MWKINELKLFPVTLSQSLINIPPSTKPMKIITIKELQNQKRFGISIINIIYTNK